MLAVFRSLAFLRLPLDGRLTVALEDELFAWKGVGIVVLDRYY